MATNNFDPSSDNVGTGTNSWGFRNSGWKGGGGAAWAAYSSTFGSGDVVDVELDMNRGNLKFFLNGKDLGVVFTGSLRGQQIIPGVCFGGQVGSKVFLIRKVCYRFPSLCVVVSCSRFGVVCDCDTSFLTSVFCAGSCSLFCG